MSTNEPTDGAVIKVPPPLYMPLAIAVALILEKLVFPLPLNWNTPATRIVGWGLIILGFGMIFSINRQMRAKGTNPNPGTPTTALLTTGIYSITRNPMYLFGGVVVAGACILFNTWWGLPAMILNWVLYYYWAIKPEEAYLEGKFGQEYLDYKKKVRRWI